jgi:hypothetical protein
VAYIPRENAVHHAAVALSSAPVGASRNERGGFLPSIIVISVGIGTRLEPNGVGRVSDEIVIFKKWVGWRWGALLRACDFLPSTFCPAFRESVRCNGLRRLAMAVFLAVSAGPVLAHGTHSSLMLRVDERLEQEPENAASGISGRFWSLSTRIGSRPRRTSRR